VSGPLAGALSDSACVGARVQDDPRQDNLRRKPLMTGPFSDRAILRRAAFGVTPFSVLASVLLSDHGPVIGILLKWSCRIMVLSLMVFFPGGLPVAAVL